MTATDARRNWFRLLDEVAAGEEVMVERGGRRIIIRRESEGGRPDAVPDYSGILWAPDAAEADAWGWEWDGPEEELRPTRDRS